MLKGSEFLVCLFNGRNAGALIHPVVVLQRMNHGGKERLKVITQRVLKTLGSDHQRPVKAFDARGCARSPRKFEGQPQRIQADGHTSPRLESAARQRRCR
jgi:hypothetical protein